jgi:UDP-N-acetyl-alpha-D-quinovosamine dehydrogenase
MRILVTGASGFVGRAVLDALKGQPQHELRAALRAERDLGPGVECVRIGDIGADTDWRAALDGREVVIHTAARVHVMRETAVDALAEFRKINVAGSLNLARQAARAGVRRFIFISSVKVNGEGRPDGRPYVADDEPAPADPYALSKLEAERGLRELAAGTGMEVVIIRPPLVYGPGVRANFLSMMRCLSRGIPLPLGAVHNRRSLVALDNLVDLVLTCIEHPAAANQVFLVSDEEDLSTSELLQRLGRALGRPARLLPVPVPLLELGARLLGRASLAQRLCGSLQMDIGKTRTLLGWTPPVSVDAALAKTARHFLDYQHE